VVTKLTASTILQGGDSSTNRTQTMSSLSDVLPRKAPSSGGYNSDIRYPPPTRESNS